ncbi:MAG: response regulator [Spirochaetes bacterium]|nr:response regulator [Spirochaetota bacterium]
MTSKKRILIVDDEQINLEFFEVMLSKLGFEVEMAENGFEALDAIRQFKPDLVLLDNVMPKLSGWEVTSILKTKEEYREFSEIPIIMFSALDDVRDKVEGLELGADDYITKPFNFSEVLARIRAILRTRDLIHQLEKRETRLQVFERLVDEVTDFIKSLRLPILGMVEATRNAGSEFGAAFIGQVQTGSLASLEKLSELERRVESLRKEADELKRAETTIHVIKKKVKEHLK